MRRRTQVSETAGEKIRQGFLNRPALKTGFHKKSELLRDAPKQNEFFFSFAVRMIGLFPGDLVGMYSGACGFTYFHYICGTLAGMFPSIITFSAMGMSAHDISSPVFWISLGCEVILVLLSLVVFILWQGKKRKESKT